MSGQQRGGRGGGGRGGGGSGGGGRGGGGRGGGGERGDRGGRGRGGRGDRGSRGPHGSDGYRPSGQQYQPTGPGPTGPPAPPTEDVFLRGQPVPNPSADVTAYENNQLELIKGRTIDGFPTRPGYGTKGTKIIVRVNCFELIPNSDPKAEVPWYKYTVSTTDAPTTAKNNNDLSKPKRRQLVEAILARSEFNTPGLIWATDYSNIIVTTKKLEQNLSGKAALRNALDEVQTTQEPTIQQGQEAQARRMKSYKVEFDNTFRLNDLMDYLRRTQHGQEFAGRADVIQLLNIIVGKPGNDSNLVSVGGQHAFFPMRGHEQFSFMDLGGGLQAQRGFFSSVRSSTSRILVNLDVANGAFFKDGPVRAFIAGICNDKNPAATDKQLLARVEPMLRHLKVSTQYLRPRDANGKVLPGKKALLKVKTLQRFSSDREEKKENFRYLSCKDTKFKYVATVGGQEQQISVADYFKNQHGITLKFPDEPPMNVGTTENKNWLPIELCSILPGQAYRGLLQGDQTSKMIRFSATKPAVKAEAIQGKESNGAGLATMRLRGNDQAQSIKPFGFGVTPRMVTVEARILAAPRLEYGGKFMVNPYLGSWNLTTKGGGHVRFFKPGSLPRWQTLTLEFDGKPPTFRDAPKELMERFNDEVRSYGINLGKPRGPDEQKWIPNPSFPSLEGRRKTNAILDGFFGTAANNKVDILLVIIKEQSPWLYSRIKYYGDVKHGVHTVVSIGAKFTKEKGQGMLWGNLALKFNIKGGGVNHRIETARMQPFDARSIIFGIDVTHPSPTSTEDSPSIAGVVASTDEFLQQWPASIRIQKRRQEIVSDLKDMVLERFALWTKRNKDKGLPTKVFVYRDGVSEGQYRDVLEYEMSAFQEAFKQLYGEPKKHPKLAIIIVGKRHHVRFYGTTEKDVDKTGNLKPGTIVDRGITDPTRHDFYLQAHGVLQGTGRSAHYDTIKDDVHFTGDQLQEFTNNLSCLFNRATKAVSVVPPAYYADLVCERARAYLHSTLQEARTSTSIAFKRETAEWTQGVHAKLQDSTFYI